MLPEKQEKQERNRERNKERNGSLYPPCLPVPAVPVCARRARRGYLSFTSFRRACSSPSKTRLAKYIPEAHGRPSLVPSHDA